MRFANQRSDSEHPGAKLTAGVLLLAHPTMEDPRFRRSVILLSAHAEGGSLGVVLNNPTGRTLGQFDKGIEESALASTPLYAGGPVGAERLFWRPGNGQSWIVPFSFILELMGKRHEIFWKTARNSPSVDFSGMPVGQRGNWRLSANKVPGWSLLYRSQLSLLRAMLCGVG